MELYRIVDRSNSRWKLFRWSCDGPLEREPGTHSAVLSGPTRLS